MAKRRDLTRVANLRERFWLTMLHNFVNALRPTQKHVIFLATDLGLAALSYCLAATMLRGENGRLPTTLTVLTDLSIILVVVGGLSAALGLNKVKLNAYERQGMVGSALVALSLAGVSIISSFLLQGQPTHPAVYIVTGMIFLILSVLVRLAMRATVLKVYQSENRRLRVLIYGAGQTGQQLATALATDDAVIPVAFVDDDPRLQSLTIAGLKVHHPSQIRKLVEHHDIMRIVLAMPSAPGTVRERLTRELADTGCEVHALPSFAALISGDTRKLCESHPVDLYDLLGRDGLDVQLPGVSDTYAERNILVTGAGGSIGSELCRQICGYRPAHIILLDHGEHALFEIHRELRALAPEIKITPILGSVCDKPLVSVLIKSQKVAIVLHAAAYKHVPMVEENAIEGMRNNVIGTHVVANAARDAKVERFILVSTDKAVRPTSVMGASKRFAEMITQDLATRAGQTRFSMVRFGNVMGSSGSVIPLFAEQIAKGGPVTLTHADVTRYFMTIPEAARLVLLAGSFARGGDVFVLDMGKPIAVRDIARKMIEGSGLSLRSAENPDGDIEIETTGLRPGEKLHEELLIGSDMLTTPHPKILRAQEGHLSEIELAKALKSLSEAIETRDVALLKSILSRWIEQTDPVDEASVNE
ncbi:NDP-sugar epimerase, includes UDP-GlcNAc-inverting 4,6-dehydratase FlaA1 and capsular polysaccharide biosynthesis protein EpsC [Roseovarius marisflavi]|uniref:NDP-sugar epimerase, includes UDP-GlcNAc-inverting 4,6-dehydratase FlaA1 and capsular polysaccharide biosynthesis protein EpsC n=1 Tax=Roseovarius marisflavi TaxID=1054996 RepID=A0A1M6ZHS7_9RHOB|nr:NDP-sugar epimerase, includes UDP-GlcNAc-inverting 4,6-dehydratase FlaA1 and capsular polysaccharide biosynthesis protein EpsC [Roseovarius marisflavi]